MKSPQAVDKLALSVAPRPVLLSSSLTIQKDNDIFYILKLFTGKNHIIYLEKDNWRYSPAPDAFIKGTDT